jgi:DNA ligase 1
MIIFKPMRGCKADLDRLVYPVYVSVKTDGIRTNLVDGLCRTKSLKPLPNIYTRELLQSYEVLRGLEAELTTTVDLSDPECFNKATSAFMRHKGQPEIRMWVFDIFIPDLTFEDRLKVMEKRSTLFPDFVTLLPQILVKNRAELDELIDQAISSNMEGIMIRHHDSLYKCGMSTITGGQLLKVKPMEDDEAYIEGFEEGTHNTNEKKTNELGRSKRSSSKAGKVPSGIVGTILGRHDKWGIVRVSGLKDDLALDMFLYPEKYLGAPFTFKYQSHGTLEAPRLAKFKGFRSLDDLSLPEEENE